MSNFTEDLKQIGRTTLTEQAPPPEQEKEKFTASPVFPGQVRALQTGLKAITGAATGVTDQSIGPAQQLEIDRRTLPAGQFALKYGKDAELARDYLPRDQDPNASIRYNESLDNRDLPTRAGDGALAIGKGAFSMASSLAALTLRSGAFGMGVTVTDLVTGEQVDIMRKMEPVVRDNSRAVSEGLLEANKSRETLGDKIAAQKAQSARMRDSALKFEQSDKGIKDQFARIGREAMISADAMGKYSAARDDLIGEGLGSTLPSLGVAGGVKAAATIALEKLAIKGLAKEAGETIATAAAVGAMEGTGAYDSTYIEIAKMTEEELMADSPVYRDLREQGVSHKAARVQVAEQAAMKAQVMTTLVAAGISLPFAGFEGGAFSRTGRRTLLSLGEDIAGQTIEESAQNVTGQLFQNVGIKEFANENQQLTEGLGEAVTQGAIGGLGATGVISSVQLPGVIVDKQMNLIKSFHKAASDLGERTIGKKLAARKIDKEAQDLAAALDGRFQEATAIVDEIDSLLGNPETDAETRSKLETARAAIEPLVQAVLDTSSDDYKARTEPFKEHVIEGKKIETLVNINKALAKGLIEENSPAAEAASDFLTQEMTNVNQIIGAMFQQEQAQTSGTEASPETQQQAATAAADEFVDNMNETPLFAKGIQKASEIRNEASAKSVESGGPIKPVTSFAEIVMNPVGVDPQRITEDTRARMPEEVARATAVIDAIQAPEHSERLNVAKGNRVNDRAGSRRETLFQSKSLKHGEVASFNDMISQLLRGAIRNKREGTTVVKDTAGTPIDAKDVLTDLRNLIQHQQNKFAAATESYLFSAANPEVNDTTRRFDSLSQRGSNFKPNGGKIYVRAGSENSMHTYRAVAEDLNTGIRAYNALLEQFPEVYQGEKIQEVTVPEVRGNQNVSATENTNPATTPAADQNQQTQPTEVVQNTAVDRDTGRNTDGLRPGQISFKDLFKGGTETTLGDALTYLFGLQNLGPSRQLVLSMLAASGFARLNPNTIVREATAEERKAAKNDHGWWDPQANEIVLFTESADKLMHEMVHATTLEALFQNLAQAHLKRVANEPLSDIEKAAVDLNDAALEFLDATPINAEMRNVQQIMRSLIDPNKTPAQQSRGMGRAISEFMAYGLTEKAVQEHLDATEWKRPSLAKGIFDMVMGLFKAIAGVPQTQPNTQLDRLFFNTRALALDTQTTVLQAREVKKAEVKDVKNGSQEKAAPGETKGKTTGAPNGAQPAEAQPADVRAPAPVEEAQPAQAEVSTPLAPETETTSPAAEANPEFDIVDKIAKVLEKGFERIAEAQKPKSEVKPVKDTITPIMPSGVDEESLQTNSENIADIESWIADSQKKLSSLYENSPVKDVLTYSEFVSIARESSSKGEQSKQIRNSKIYQSAIQKLEAYEQTNNLADGLAFAEEFNEAENHVKDIRGLQKNLAEEQQFRQELLADVLSTEQPAPVASPSTASAPTPVTAPADAGGTTAAETKAAPVSATEPAAPVEEIPQEVTQEETRPEETDTGLPADFKPTYELGSTLLAGKNGPSYMSKLLTKLAPVLQPGDTFNRLLAHVAPSLAYKVTPEMKQQAENVRQDAFKALKGMQERLAQQIATKKAKNGQPLLSELQNFVRGNQKLGNSEFNPARSGQFRIAAWLDAQSIIDGKPKFDEHLLMLALMAAADYVMNTENSRGVYKTDELLKILGLSNPNKITDEMRMAVNAGRPGTFVKQALAAHIREFMGAELNNTISDSQTEGVFEALAHEILDYFASQPAEGKNFWFKSHTVKMPGDRTVTAFSFGKPEKWLQGAGRTLLRDMMTSKSSDMHRYSIGKKWGKNDVARTLKKNKHLKLSKKQRLAIQKQQDTPFYFSQEFFDAVHKFRNEQGNITLLQRIMGYERIDQGTFFNAEHEGSVVGKNASVTYSIKQAIEQMKRIEAYSEKHGIPMTEVPVYYRITIGDNTRFNFDGFNPQQNKFAREMFSPTRQTVDLTNERALNKLWAAIGQSLGVKVENEGIVGAAEMAKAKIENEYARIIELLSGDASKIEAQEELYQEFKKLDGLKEDVFTLKGLWTAMRIKAAETAGETSLTTDMPMELDGKTHGPISAAIHHFLGPYSPEILATWRRGGYFLSNAFNENGGIYYTQWHKGIDVQKDKEGNPVPTPDANRSNADFYGRIGELMAKTLTDIQKRVLDGFFFGDARTAEEHSQWQADGNRAFRGVMGVLNSVFGDDIEVTKVGTEGLTIRINRGATKSPITKNIYGAGARSIAMSFAKEIQDHVYEQLTKIGRGDQVALKELRELAAILDNLLTHDVKYDQYYKSPEGIKRSQVDGPSLKRILTPAVPSKEVVRTFKFSDAQFERLAKSVQAFYITGFTEALDQAVDPSVARLNKDLIVGTQAHGAAYQRLIRKALSDKHAELVREGIILETEELPRDARNKILEEYRDLAPIIDNGITIFDIAGTTTETSTDVKRRRFGQQEARKKGKNVEVEPAFNPRSRTLSGREIDSRRPIVGDVGVSVLPLNTQTNSDVRMQIETWTHPDYPTNALAVHDANIHATNDLEAASAIMNEAVSKAWHTNTLRPILEAYDRALKFDDGGEDFAKLREMRDFLEYDVLHRDARIAAEKKVFTSFHGVPGVDVPFVQEGQRFNSEKELIDFLNQEVANYINTRKGTVAIQSTTDTEVVAPDKPVYQGGDILTYLEKLGNAIKDPDNIKILEKLLSAQAFRSMIERGLQVNMALPFDVETKGKFIDSENLSPESNEAIDFYLQLGIKAEGLYSGPANKVWIYNAVPEVVLHELLHTATMHQVFNYYNNPELLSPKQKAAVQAIEKIMLDYFRASKGDPDLQSAAEFAISDLYATGNVAGAVAEFITYGLTNPELKEQLKASTQKASVLTRIFNAMKRAISVLLGFKTETPPSFYDQLIHKVDFLLEEKVEPMDLSGINVAAISSAATGSQNAAEIKRKLDLQMKLATQVQQYLEARRNGDTDQETRTQRAVNAAAYTQAKLDANDAINTMVEAGFTIDGPQDVMLFQTLFATVSADMKTDRVALQEIQQVYNAVIEKLGTDSFEKFGPSGVTGQIQSQRMYAAVLGQSFFDVTGARQFLPPRSSAGVERLAAFVALAQVSPELREVLSKIDLADLKLATEIDNQSGVDGLLGSLAERVMSRVTGRVLEANGNKSTPTNVAMDVLTEQLAEYTDQSATAVEEGFSNASRGLNAAIKTGMESSAVVISDALQRSAANASSEASALIQNLAASFADIFSEGRATVRADNATSYLNQEKIWEPLRNFWAEMRSINPDTVTVLRLVKKAKDEISRVRQEYIDQVPRIIRNSLGPTFEAMKNNEKKKVLEAMYHGLGKTDFGIVDKVIGSRSALKFFGTDQRAKDALKSEIAQMKEAITRQMSSLELPASITNAYIKKAEQLGEYMITKKTGKNLLTNAVSILNLHNEEGHLINEADYKALQDKLKADRDPKGNYVAKQRKLIDTIDALASLEAIARLDDATHEQMAQMVKDNEKGVLETIDYLSELHRQESAKVDLNSMAALNGIKGFFQSNSQRKHKLVVASNDQEQDLRLLGYKKIRAFESHRQHFDPNTRDQSYFFSAVNGLATYNQGAMQTVQDTYFGTDPATGFVVGAETTNNRITGKEMKLLNRRIKAHSSVTTEDGLIPRFARDGTLVAFEEAVAADVYEMLNHANDYADSLGRWAGRIQEERASHGLNIELMDALHAKFVEDNKAGRGSEYARFGREQKADGTWDFTDDLLNDPIWKESYLLIPKDIREYGENLFDGPIMVRRDLINNAFGYRSASVGDIFTGKSRISEEYREGIKEIFLSTPFLGENAYQYLTTAEESIQALVSGVKHIIVVKSGVVMIANTLANVAQLMTREVPISYITQRTRSKWAELDQYKNNEALKIELRYKLNASKSNAERANLQARIHSIDEANKKMTIWKLIEAHQFTTISEGLTDADRDLFNKGFGDWIEKKAGELPGPLSTIARYGLVAKDTALYQGLAKGVQYSDFIAKAIYYDFLTEERGVSHEDALLKIDQEYINYDLNDSRFRSYGESIGLWWFMNFKLRSLKIALDMIRNNPASALIALSTWGAIGLPVGSPVTDNIVGVMADGRLGYSVGPGMVEAGWNLNIWHQLLT